MNITIVEWLLPLVFVDCALKEQQPIGLFVYLATEVINTNGVQESIVYWKFKLTVMTGLLHTSVTVARTT